MDTQEYISLEKKKELEAELADLKDALALAGLGTVTIEATAKAE